MKDGRFDSAVSRISDSQGVFLWTLRVCTLGFWVPKPWNMALNKGIWDPKLRGTNIKGTNLKSVRLKVPGFKGSGAYRFGSFGVSWCGVKGLGS